MQDSIYVRKYAFNAMCKNAYSLFSNMIHAVVLFVKSIAAMFSQCSW